MLLFIIPLKSKEASKSWTSTCQLLERCLRSICNQINPYFRVLVVCNNKPNIAYSHPQIEYLKVDLGIPKNHKEKSFDKSKKTILGLMYSQNMQVDHVMIVDADDCVSNRIADYVNHHVDSDGWILKRGYIYEEKDFAMRHLMRYERFRFNQLCGSCNILKFDLYPLPEDNGDFSDELIYFYSGFNHMNIERLFKEKGLSLKTLPFPAVVYIVGNGENISQNNFAKLNGSHHGKIFYHITQMRKLRPVLPSIKREFGLYTISK